jgi:hypothetical protein
MSKDKRKRRIKKTTNVKLMLPFDKRIPNLVLCKYWHYREGKCKSGKPIENMRRDDEKKPPEINSPCKKDKTETNYKQKTKQSFNSHVD